MDQSDPLIRVRRLLRVGIQEGLKYAFPKHRIHGYRPLMLAVLSPEILLCVTLHKDIRRGGGVPVFPMTVSMTTSVNIAIQIIGDQFRDSVKFVGKYPRYCLL
jgi:hypothetical protein